MPRQAVEAGKKGSKMSAADVLLGVKSIALRLSSADGELRTDYNLYDNQKLVHCVTGFFVLNYVLKSCITAERRKRWQYLQVQALR